MSEKRARGFAAMNREQQRQIASMGGRAAHQRGTAHEWTSREAAEAGRKGGKAAHRSTARTERTDSTPDAARETSRQPTQAMTENTPSEPQWSEQEYENRSKPGGSVNTDALPSPNTTTV